MPKVFITNKGSHDYNDALRYGEELVFVTEGIQNRFSVNQMKRLWLSSLNTNKVTSEDYIMVTSLSILTAIGCVLFAIRFKKLNFLLYRSGKYIARTIMFEEEEIG